MTNAERQAAYLDRQRALGMEKFSCVIPKGQIAELRALLALLKNNPELTVKSITVQDGKTGRLQGVKMG